MPTATAVRTKLEIPAPTDEAVVFAELEGLSPLLMHRWSDDQTVGVARTTSKERPTPEVEAEACAYRLASGELYLPSAAIRGAIVTAGKFFQDPGYKKGTLMGPLSASIAPIATEGSILYRDGEPITEFEVDSRRCVIPSTKGAVTRNRARIDAPWSTTIEMAYDAMTMSEDALLRALMMAGRKIGVLNFRPEKKGPFGRFRVTSFEVEIS